MITKETLTDLFLAGVSAVLPENLVRMNVGIFGPFIKVGRFRFRGGVHVLGSGKASVRMANEVVSVLRDRIVGGVVIGVKGGEVGKGGRIEFYYGTHPLPSRENVEATERLVAYLKSLGREDRFIYLLSGGTSALLEKPIPPITLEDLMATTDLLLKSGMDIRKINAVRKHLSEVKGGRLSEMTEAKGYVLVLSDVVGDDLSSIGSGPFYPDPTTYEEVYGLLREYGVWDRLPESVRRVITAGVEGEIPETPKTPSPRIHHLLIGNNRTALLAIREAARGMGLRARIMTDTLQGEAREVARVLYSLARHVALYREPFSPPVLLIFGGETTVTVRGKGKGGRNQELALAFLKEMEEDFRIILLSAGTDGIDGPTDVAGAVVSDADRDRALREGLNMEAFLNENDSYAFHRAMGTHVRTGPTGTNVADVLLMYVEGKK